MAKIVDKIAALGVPGMVLLAAMAVSGFSGAAAITAALALLGGPLGMLGGIGLLGILGLIAMGLTKYGFGAPVQRRLLRWREGWTLSQRWLLVPRAG